ncbi:MAG: acyl-CoA synthetase [Luteimonas sp.]|nr:acyl-CoA synthetase [Luteimonas sp.]
MSAVIQTSPSLLAMSMHAQPLAVGDGRRAIAFDARGDIALDAFLSEVRGVAATLPEARYAINLCDDRYRFLVAFCAVALRGQTTLLPPSRAPAAIEGVQRQHPDSYCIGDDCVSDGALPLLPQHHVRMPDILPRLDGPSPHIGGEALVAIGFTSGSTGCPKPNAKTWNSFRTSTAQNLAALQDLWPDGATPHIVATVPPQHMYGMELSVLLPLLGGAAVHGARPFFPGDVAAALRDARTHRLLVTTPVHLRALVESRVDLPALAAIVTATAPLPQALAAAAEALFGCEVREMFGSTETCVIARRRTAIEERWTPLPGVRVHPQPDGTLVHAAHLPAPVALADLVEVDGDGAFRLRGRQEDLLEIAGKRASLGDLTRCLLAVPGVEDGVVLQLDEREGNGVRRIAALVVAPMLDEASIMRVLRDSIDPVFLPRRLLRVDALPRNATGKLPRDELLRLLQRDMA